MEIFCFIVLEQMGQANASGPSLIGTFWKEENEEDFEEMFLYSVFKFAKNHSLVVQMLEDFRKF